MGKSEVYIYGPGMITGGQLLINDNYKARADQSSFRLIHL